MDQVFLLGKKYLLDQTVLCEKDRQGRDGGWREERAKKTRKCHKTSVIKTRPKTWWSKTYVKKEMMAIEKIGNTEAASKSSPKKGNPGVKAKSKGTPFAPQKKMKKNTPKKSSGGLELNFNRVKIWNHPMKITLITDFINSIKYICSLSWKPDPNVIDGLRTCWLKS